jgi:A/G-specific adenine glycosylase
VRAPKRAPKQVHAVAALMMRRGTALAVQRPVTGLLGGLWELPGGEIAARERGPGVLARVLRERTGLEVAAIARAGRFDYAFTHRALRITVYRCEASGGRVRLDGWDRHRWVAPETFAELPIGTVSKRALEIAFASNE